MIPLALASYIPGLGPTPRSKAEVFTQSGNFYELNKLIAENTTALSTVAQGMGAGFKSNLEQGRFETFDTLIGIAHSNPEFKHSLATGLKQAVTKMMRKKKFSEILTLLPYLNGTDFLKSALNTEQIKIIADHTLVTGSKNALSTLAKFSDGNLEHESAICAALTLAMPEIVQKKDFERFNDALRVAQDHPFLLTAISRAQILETALHMSTDGYPSDFLALQKLRPAGDPDLDRQIAEGVAGFKIIEVSRQKDTKIPASTAIMIPSRETATPDDVRIQFERVGDVKPSTLLAQWKKLHPNQDPKPLLQALKAVSYKAASQEKIKVAGKIGDALDELLPK